MSPFVVNSLIVVSLIICAIAILYIRKHYGQIRDAKQLQEDTQVQMSKRYDEQRAYLIESVQVIARAIGSDEKLSYTEACMRLAALLRSLAPHLLDHADFSVINEVYKRTEHIPILANWKELSKQEQWKFRQEMSAIEKEFAKEVDHAAKLLSTYDFKKMVH